MSLTAKFVIVLLCFALCGAGTFIASTAREQSQRPRKTNVIPVKIREVTRHIWMQV